MLTIADDLPVSNYQSIKQTIDLEWIDYAYYLHYYRCSGHSIYVSMRTKDRLCSNERVRRSKNVRIGSMDRDRTIYHHKDVIIDSSSKVYRVYMLHIIDRAAM